MIIIFTAYFITYGYINHRQRWNVCVCVFYVVITIVNKILRTRIVLH